VKRKKNPSGMQPHSVSTARAPNCAYGAGPKATCAYTAVDPTNGNTVSGFVETCSDASGGKPDYGTHTFITDLARSKLPGSSLIQNSNVSVECTTNTHKAFAHGSPTTQPTLSVKELHKHRMASNCAPTFDLNNVIHINRYSCQYYGERQDDYGNKGYNLGDRIDGFLASCDSEGYDPRTETDIRNLVAEQLGGPEDGIDPSKVRCEITSVPMT